MASRASSASATFALAGIVWLAGPLEAFADTDAAITPESWWRTWNWDPVVLFNLLLLWGLYGLGLSRLWRRAGVGRGIGRAQPVAFLAGLVVILVALLSPLDALSDELASAHMVQHLLLMLVAAPLIVLGSPGLVLTWAFPRSWRPTAGRLRRRVDAGSPLLWNPVFVLVLYAVVSWVWHLPVLYEAALRHPLVHDVQHLTFFAAAFLFWRALIDPISRLRVRPPLAVFLLFTTTLHAAVLGVFMTLAPRPWYPAYEGHTAPWGLTLLEDQQLAGLIMWIPGCSVYVVPAVILFAIWLNSTARVNQP